MRVIHKVILTLLSICLVFTPGAVSQDTLLHNLSATAGYHRGFLIAHRPLIVPLQQDKINGFEFAITKNTAGDKSWHHLYRFPGMGISLAFWELGNPRQLGTGITLIPYMDFPLTEGKLGAFGVKFGWGLGFIEKTFDSDNNHKNVAIGSSLNTSLILQPHIRLNISNRLSFHGGISMTHFSNGSVVIPNLGLNIASITSGVSYHLGKPVVRQQRKIPRLIKQKNISFFGAASLKQVYPANGKNYFAASLSFNHAWKNYHKSAFGAGADIFYDHSIYRKIEEKNITLSNSFETIKTGIHGSYELIISDLSLLINMGGYLYSKLDDGLFYHRFGMRYMINESLFACFHIKSHWGKADFFEFGLGYRKSKLKHKS